MSELPGWDELGAMTAEQARLLREPRVDRGLTWRSVAEECAGADDDWAESHAVSRMLCERAARMLGEDPNSNPWN